MEHKLFSQWYADSLRVSRLAASPQSALDKARSWDWIYQSDSGNFHWIGQGYQAYENLRQFIGKIHQKNGYQFVKSPSLVPVSHLVPSGHWEKYSHFIYQASGLQKHDESAFALRPMSCPSHVEIYNSKPRHRSHLPFSIFEFGDVFRNEPSGSLMAFFRQRQFCQDDGHVVCLPEQIEQVANRYLDMAQQAYSELGFKDISFALSLRPKNFLGSSAQWDVAEQKLKDILSNRNMPFVIEPEGGAFYGPKIEIWVKDHLNRQWQCGVFQLDFQLPERLNMRALDDSGSPLEVVLIHHAVLGSLERMMGVLLESFDAPSIPIDPRPIVLMSVSSAFIPYALQCAQALESKGHQVLVDEGPDRIGKKMAVYRQAQYGHLLVVGQNEQAYYQEHQRHLVRGTSWPHQEACDVVID